MKFLLQRYMWSIYRLLICDARVEEELEKVAPWLEDGGPATQAKASGYRERYSNMSPEQRSQVQGGRGGAAGVQIVTIRQVKGQVGGAAPQAPAGVAQYGRSPRMNNTVPAKSQRERRYQKIMSNGYGQPLSKRSTARKRKAARFVDDAADLLLRQMLPE